MSKNNILKTLKKAQTEAIRRTALETLRTEAATLSNMVKFSVTPQFCAGVEAIFFSKGRLIVTGMGKSALVAQKIVATLNSTGTPAVYMHAADAIHGDIGMVLPGDWVLCLSKSGETPEIRVLAPIAKARAAGLIAMTANDQSYLATLADFTFFTPIEREADPNNLAPTSSTTAQMALGDALATALLALRGFSSKDFAQFHPGGALGKQLYLRVSDISKQQPRPQVQPESPLRDVILEISANRLGIVAVTSPDGYLLGVVTDGDLRRMLQLDVLSVATKQAKDIMTAQPKTVHSDAMATEALHILQTHKVNQLVVLDALGKYEGVIHIHDLLREGLF